MKNYRLVSKKGTQLNNIFNLAWPIGDFMSALNLAMHYRKHGEKAFVQVEKNDSDNLSFLN